MIAKKFKRIESGATYITDGVDVDIILGTLRVRYERLDEELSKDAFCVFNLLRLASSLSNPSFRLGPSLVQSQKA